MIIFKNFLCSILVFFCIYFFNIIPVFSSEKSITAQILHAFYKPVEFFLPHLEYRTTLYEADTHYFHVIIEKDTAGYHHLVYAPRHGSQAIFDPANPDKLISGLMFFTFLTIPAINRNPENILIIGLGGGIMPTFLRKHFPETTIDIVEIDPMVLPIAKEYFGFKPDSGMHIYFSDGRVYVNKTNTKYDIILIDVYNAKSIPFQFTTVEFYKQIKRILSPDGVCAVNLADLKQNNFIQSEINTIINVFSDCLLFITENKTNYIALFSNNKLNIHDLKQKCIDIDNTGNYNFSFAKLLDNRIYGDTLTGFLSKSNIIFTDDFAPVD